MSLPTRLLLLDLRSDLVFPLPLRPEAGPGGFFPRGPEGEAEEELHLLGEDYIDGGPEGPHCPAALPLPLGSWRTEDRGRAGPTGRGPRPADAAATAPRGEPGGARLAAGPWLFAQFRPRGAAELAQGLEWFLREAWWERRSLVGPLYLRLVREDGALAFQLLRRLAG